MQLIASDTDFSSPPQVVVTEALKRQQTSKSFPFQLSYNLAEHRLFQISRLVELANFIASQDPTQVTCVVTGGSSSNRNWSGRIQQERFAEIANHAEESGLLILIEEAQKDPKYHSLLEQIANELEALVEKPLRQQGSWLETYIFIAPPIVKDRHLNSEANFLFQVHEKKAFDRRNHNSIFISFISFPGEDRTVSLNVLLVKPAISIGRKGDRNRSPYPGARLGRDPDGTPAWYVSDPEQPGKYLQVGSVL